MCIDVRTAMQAVISVLLKGLHWQLTFFGHSASSVLQFQIKHISFILLVAQSCSVLR